MQIRQLTLKNWRNFKNVDIQLQQRLFIYGPNASGKSNLLDAIRFLSELTELGGGLQKAVSDRQGVKLVRSLAARNHNKGNVTLAVAIEDGEDNWNYELTFNSVKQRPMVVNEIVQRNGADILRRPDDLDKEDGERLTQTALEQVGANRDFRVVARFLGSIQYLHLVPQVIRDPTRSGEKPNDPFGGDFLARVARSTDAERSRRLKVINAALKLAVPQLVDIELTRDKDQRPHLGARYVHWRVADARQEESEFSDGTLRLIGLLWSLQERGQETGPILLEEPELSLHEEVVCQLPTLISKSSRNTGRQVLATTHAGALLEDEGLGLDEVLVLKPSSEGTSALLASDLPNVAEMVGSVYSLREALAEHLKPHGISELARLPFR